MILAALLAQFCITGLGFGLDDRGICQDHETTFFAASMFAVVTPAATIPIWRLR